MKNDRLMQLATPLLVFSALSLGAGSVYAEDEFIARAVSVSGKVLARVDGGGSVQMTFLKPGDKLYKGSIVNTGSNGAVKLLMTDRTVLDLGPSSLFKMNDYQLTKGQTGDRKVDLSLDYGTVRASVNEKLTTNKAKFTIRTKAATMGVRGTEFVVNSPIPEKNANGSVEPPKMQLTVMHGKVDVADPKAGAGAPAVPVTPGLQYAKSGDGMGKVAQLGTQEVAKIKNDAFQKDMTFLQAVSFDPASNKSSESRSNDGDGKSEGKNSGQATADNNASSGNSGAQTIENIGATVESQAQNAPPPAIGDLQLPGTFAPGVPPQRPIDQLNGQLKNLTVRICPSGGC